MKVEIKGRNVQLLARIVISLKQFHGTVNVEMDKEKLVLRARNPLNGRSVLHIFKDDFFSVQDKCDVTSNMIVNISDMVDSFESIGAMDGESDNCVLEIADNKMNINFTYLFDEKVININDIRVDGVLNENLNGNFNQIYLKDNNLQNKIYFKKLLNDAIRSYVG